ncbi:MAG: T9SS type A sorting domain-containing protein [Aureispira sp.]
MKPILKQLITLSIILGYCLLPELSFSQTYTYHLIDNQGNTQALVDGSTTNLCAGLDYRLSVTVTGSGRKTIHISGTSADIVFNNGIGVTGGSTPTICPTNMGAAGTGDYDMPLNIIGTAAGYSITVSRKSSGGGCNAAGNSATFNFTAFIAATIELDPSYEACSNSSFVLHEEGSGANDRCNNCFSGSLVRAFEWERMDVLDFAGTGSITPVSGISAGGVATALDHTISLNDIAAVNAATTQQGGRIRMRGRATTTYAGNGLTCVSEETTDVIVFPAPVLSAIATVSTPTGAHPSAADELCIDGTRNYRVNCSGGGCPPTTANYFWGIYSPLDNGTYYWESTVSNYTVTGGGNISDAVFQPNTLVYANNPNRAPRYGVPGDPVIPGDYTAIVWAENPNTTTIECGMFVVDDLILNPKPGVEIFHNTGDGNYGAGDFTQNGNGTVICNGVDVGLSLRDCNSAGYGAQATPNNVADPNNNGIGTVPCTGNGEYFQSVTWTASTIVAANPVNLNVTDPSGPTTNSTGITINPTTAATNYVTSTAGFGGGSAGNTITYTASVIGANGCTNSDDIEIVVQEPTLSFAVDADNNSPYNACQNTTPTITVSCDLCLPQTTFSSGGSISWTDPGNLLAAPLTTNPIQYSSAITAPGGTVQNFTVNLTGDNGCIASATQLDINVEDQPNISPTVVNTMPMCSDDALQIDVSAGYNTTYRYGLYRTNPTIGSPTDYLNCGGSCGTIVSIPSGNVFNNTNYYVRAVSSFGCEDIEQVVTTTDIRPTPVISLQGGYPTSICNNRFHTFRINGDVDYNYTWIIDSSSLTGTSSYTPGNPGQANKSRGFGWSPDNISFTLFPGMGAQPNLGIGVTAELNGCVSSQIDITPDIEVAECNNPVLSKFLTNASGGGTRDYRYICVGDDLRVSVFLPNSSGAVTYAWNTGETTSFVDYTGSLTSADSIVHTVTVTDNNGTQVASTVTYISKGGVTLLPGTDTTICANGQINAIASCPECLSDLNYLWYNDGTNTPFETDVATDGNILQSAVVVAPNATVSNFLMRLVVAHGETCRDTVDRQITVDGLPEPVITDVSTGDTLRTVQYLCTGETLQLNVGCPTCNTYVWNTTATTPNINVNSPGVYFARALNTTLCSEISQTVVVLGSSQGYNSPVVVNPSDICSNQASTLEVAPCIGCSYAWYNTNNTTTSVSTNRSFSTAVAGNYYGVVTNMDNCEYPTSIVNLSNTAVTIPTISSTTDSICAGRTSTLSTASLAGASYQWYKDSLPVSGAIDSIYTVDTQGFYNVLVTYSNGCEEFSPTTEIVNISFDPIIASADTIVCFGLTEEITAPLTPGWQYQWFRDGDSILVNGNGSNYQADSAGSYYVEIIDNNFCREESNIIYMTISNIPSSSATTSTPAVCPGDEGVLSVSLCSGCEYEWFSINTASSISQGQDPTYYRYRITPTATGSYYSVVSKDGCEVISDTISIILNTAPIPPINFVSRVVCNGSDALLNTQNCTGCSYTWLKNGSPAIGALNDTFHVVDRVADVGLYSVIVDYPNGCSEVSTTTRIFNGTYSVGITTNAIGYTSGSTAAGVICNGRGVVVGATTTYQTTAAFPTPNPPTGTFTYTLFVDGNPVSGASNIASNTDFYNFNGNITEGIYTIGVVDPRGCRQISRFIPLDTVNIVPSLSARATANPNSIPASAICDNDGTVYMEVTVGNCPTCNYNYQWARNGINITGATLNTYLTANGPSGAGIYSVEVARRGCSATSNTASIIDATATFNNTIGPDTASICNGQATTLGYTGATCTGCSYRWLRTGNPIGGANNQQYVATTLGNYNLEVTTPLGCVDTSNVSVVRSIARPDSFRLQLDTVVAILGTTNSGTGTPIAASATPIDLNSWVFPSRVRNGSFSTTTGDSSYFTSTPFNAALNCGGAVICNPGLSGPDSILFTPADSLVGNHLITYHYVESGCEFIAQDILRVLPAATISITNNNPASVPYEACIGDQLSISAQNLKFRVEEVYVFDANGNYQLATAPINFVYDTITYGSDTFYNSTITWEVPSNAYASYLMLTNTTPAPTPVGLDTIDSPFLLIHNTDLSFAGLPSSGELCSNGERLTLFGNPQGGTYSVRDTFGNNMPGTIIADSLYPTAINRLLYNDTSQLVDVVYSYNEQYTNGNNCPSLDFVTQRIKAIDVQLDNVDYNVISVSQDQEALTNLVYQVAPYNARANKQDYYTIGFSGSFTSPAGAPENFLPNNAGVGRHALTYKITKGTCTNSIEDSIDVVPAPIDIALPDTICRNFAMVNFGRDAAFPYIPNSSPPPPNGSVSYTDTTYFMRVRGAGVTQNNIFLGSETFTYDPNGVTGNHDTLVIEYVFYRDEDTLTVDFDTLEYIVASIVKPIYIEDLLTVAINDTVVQPFYCQDSTLSILTASPADTFGRGLFMLFGGTGQYQSGDTLFNSVINPYQVNNSENATTTYNLVYILNGVACENADTMPITISKGLNPSFVTANGLDEFCDTDPAVAIIQNVIAPDTAIWKIGGIPQPSYSFDPDQLNPGIHVVDLQQIYTYIQAPDTFVCSASATDTFTIHALPNINVTPGLDKQYCANDTIVDFIVSPAPDCPMFGAAGHYVLEENFDAGVPASWIVNTIAGKPWAPDALFPQGGTGLATFVDTSNVVENSWLVSPTMNLIAGHTYRLSYMVLAGPADPNCGSGCVASLYVGIGNSSATTSITTQLDYQPLIDNDLAYRRYTVDYFHNPGAGATTGQYHMGFRNFSPAFGRALRLDNVEMRDLTVDSCMQAGIGYMEGPGVYQVQDSLYQFDPLSVPAGNITVKYVYTNTMGCQDSVVFPITVDTAPVVNFTNLDTSYCENEPTVMLTGNPLGGTFTSTQGTNLYDDTTFATLSPAFYPVSFQTNTPGLDIISYTFTDNNNCSATAVDRVNIVELLDRNPIAGLDTRGYGYCIVDSANALLVTNIQPLGSGSLITNGTFYGPGVRNGAAGAVIGGATFHSDSAVIDMGHTGDAVISYIYTTTTNCLDTTYQTVRVHAAPDLSFVNLPDSLCLNVDSFRVIVQNRVVTGPTGQVVYMDTLGRQVGQFSETDIFGNPVNNFIQLFDTLYPYEAAGYSQINVSYLYITDTSLGVCEAVLEDSVRIDSIPVVYFQGLQDHYCENDPASIFLAFPSFNVGSGYLLIDSTQIDSSFYWIDPAIMVGPGQTTAVYPTYYTFTDSRGCQSEVFDTFEVRPYPRITFSATAQDTFCRQLGQRYDLRQAIVAPLGGFFTDNLALTSIRDSFFLDLGSQPGPRLVTYNYLDPTTMCQNSDSIWIYLFSAPELDFAVYGGCSQMDVRFDGSANNLIGGVDSITRIWWDFEGNGTLTYTQLDTSPITIPDTTYQYSASGTYNVTLYVQNQGSCVQSITKPLIISPYYNLATGDYFEDFNAGAGDWFDEQPLDVTPNDIWNYQPNLNGTKINSPNGAWVTNGDTLYMAGEAAWVYSPCFDFTNSVRPMIAFDLWRDMLEDIDGTVMEYYDNNTNTWERVGDVGEGILWYQSNILLARPGAQQGTALPRGWTGQSNGFESARLRLDQFKGERDIRFRLAFATSQQTVIDSLTGAIYEGAAFDNVWIGERSRNVLVEHFSNEHYQTLSGLTSDDIDGFVYNKIYNPNYGNDVILLQYQTNEPGPPDPINQSNNADLSGRSFGYYSAGADEIRIDGRLIGTGRSTDLNEWEMDYDMLQFPDFEIRIAQPITVVGNEISSNATIEALVDKDSAGYDIHMAIVQDSLNFNARNFEMLSIVRKMEPSNIGIPENHGWVVGQTATIAHTWDYTNQLNTASFNPNELEVVVFIQKRSTKEVFQATTTQDMNRYNGTQTIAMDPRTEIFDLNVYPNPSSDLFNVAFDKALGQTYNWRLVDVAGRTLQVGTAEAGTEQFTIDANRLTDGAYFFVINSEDHEVYAQRKLIVIKR